MQSTNANTSNVFFGNIPQNSGLNSKDVQPTSSGSTWMFRLIREISTFKGLVFLLFGLSILSAVLNIIPPLLLQFAIDNYILKGNEMGLLIILIALIGLGALIAIQSYLQRRLSQYIGFNVIKNLRNELFEHISRLPFEFFDQTTTGDVVARITSDTDQLTNFLNNGFINFVINIFMLIGILIVFFFWNY